MPPLLAAGDTQRRMTVVHARLELVFVTPHRPGIPSRPAALLDALDASGAFDRITVVNRLSPRELVRRRRSGDLGGSGRRRLVEHPWPFGTAERAFLRRLLRSIPEPRVAWIADPKSAGLLADLSAPGTVGILDAYDAWDRSPLVVGGRRRRAVTDGYRVAASAARLIFANTREMQRRLQEMGAKDVRVLANAAPPIRPLDPGPDPYLVYVGRVHERFDTSLVAAVADRLPDVPIVIAGRIEREPAGWADLIARGNIRLDGPVPYELARELIGRSRGLLVPHRPDDYTRSQDAMKAWDAISVGAPVLSTSVPPADQWPEPLAAVADEPADFAAKAVRLVEGQLDAGRQGRLELAAANTWPRRAEAAVAAIREAGGWD